MTRSALIGTASRVARAIASERGAMSAKSKPVTIADAVSLTVEWDNVSASVVGLR